MTSEQYFSYIQDKNKLTRIILVVLWTILLGSWFQKHMACGKNDVLYTVVLVCGTRNRSEWSLVRREVRLR
jgi:hypothetical protein